MPNLRLMLAIAAAAALLAGCGSSAAKQPDPARAASTPGKSVATNARRGSKLKVIGSDYGQILADGHGRALYVFTADGAGRSSCAGACAAAWPPYIVKRKPVAGVGARGRLIGTTTRGDG